MTTKFKVLATLEATHAYHGGIWRDVAFVVPADTAALVRRGRLLTKVVGGRFYVLFEAGDDGTPIVKVPGGVLRVGLRPTSATFANITALAFTPGQAVAVYANSPVAGQLAAPVVAAPTGRLLARTLAHAARPVGVTVANESGDGPETMTVTEAHGLSAVSVDLGAFPPGLYTLVEDYGAGGQESARYYLDPELSRERLLGVVEIAIDAAFYTAPPAFQVAYQARADTLKYYVVASHYSDADFDQIAVAQAAANGPPEITFTRQAAATFTATDLPPAVLATGENKVALFRSNAPVARRAGGYKRVQLSRNGEVIVENLPQVGTERPTADVIVHLSKPKP